MNRDDRWIADGGKYELRTIKLMPGYPDSDARRMLTDAAEYGRWELAKSTLYYGGMRQVVLRRKALDVRATVPSSAFDQS